MSKIVSLFAAGVSCGLVGDLEINSICSTEPETEEVANEGKINIEQQTQLWGNRCSKNKFSCIKSKDSNIQNKMKVPPFIVESFCLDNEEFPLMRFNLDSSDVDSSLCIGEDSVALIKDIDIDSIIDISKMSLKGFDCQQLKTHDFNQTTMQKEIQSTDRKKEYPVVAAYTKKEMSQEAIARNYFMKGVEMKKPLNKSPMSSQYYQKKKTQL